MFYLSLGVPLSICLSTPSKFILFPLILVDAVFFVALFLGSAVLVDESLPTILVNLPSGQRGIITYVIFMLSYVLNSTLDELT